MDLKEYIRSIPDYPKKGILFRDITTLIKNENAFSETINIMIEKLKKYEFDLLRNWHWMWSKFYYNKKHSGFLLSTIKIFPNFLSAIIKYIFYLLLFKNQKRKIYKMRLLGIINSFIGKKSFYRID